MGQPTGDQVGVATSTLRSEAAEWDTESTRLAALANKAAGMEFGRLEAGIFQLMVGPYDALVQLVTQRCQEGTTATAGVADALRGVADAYDTQDKAAASRIHKSTS